MNHMGGAATPWHLWLVGIVGTLWNGFGATDYTMTQTGNRAWLTSQGLTEAQTDAMFAYMDTYPAWADALWAFGVWGGLAGSLLLLLRRRWAVPAFLVSLLGAVVSFVSTSSRELPPELAELNQGAIMYIVVAIAVFLLWYAARMRKAGVLR